MGLCAHGPNVPMAHKEFNLLDLMGGTSGRILNLFISMYVYVCFYGVCPYTQNVELQGYAFIIKVEPWAHEPMGPLGPWDHGPMSPMCPWPRCAHWPMGSCDHWAHGTMGQWAQCAHGPYGLMGPWAHGPIGPMGSWAHGPNVPMAPMESHL